MNLATINTEYFCGIDLHKDKMYVYIMDRAGNKYLHQNMPCNFETFLRRVQPWSRRMAVSVETMYSNYWLYDACVDAGIPFYLGHPYYMKSIHGGKRKMTESIPKRSLTS